MMAVGLIPPLRHRAAVSRNAETGESPTHQPLPPRLEPLHAALPCHFWEVEEVRPPGPAGLHEGPNVVVISEAIRMLVSRDADIEVGDIVTSVTYPAGPVVTADPMRVVKTLWRSTHREVGLELLRGPERPGS